MHSATADDAQPTSTPWTAAAPLGRPSWSGLLQFSLVGIPLKAFPAVRTREAPSFHQLHASCGQRIRYAKQCPTHGAVDAAAIVRAFEYGPGQHVVVEPEELDQLRPVPDRALRLERFLEPAQVDPLLYSGRGLYLVPDGAAAEPAYAVLCQAMAEQNRWALGQVVLGGHRQLVLVRPAGTVLVMQVLHYPEHLRAYPRLASPRSSGPSQELDLAGQLIDAASGGVDWTAYRDQAAQELRGLVDAKLKGQPAIESKRDSMILPLLQALKQSVAQTRPTARPQGKNTASRKRGKRTA